MRGYKAARRAAQREPVEFTYSYEQVVESEAGEERVEERETKFSCRGKVDTLLLSELAYNSDVDVADPEGMKLIREFFAQAFGVQYLERKRPEGGTQLVPINDERFQEYRRFFSLHGLHGDDELLMEIVQGLIEDFAARPTQLPLPSFESSPTTGAAGRVVSLQERTERAMTDEEAWEAANQEQPVPGEVVSSEATQSPAQASRPVSYG